MSLAEHQHISGKGSNIAFDTDQIIIAIDDDYLWHIISAEVGFAICGEYISNISSTAGKQPARKQCAECWQIVARRYGQMLPCPAQPGAQLSLTSQETP